MTLIVLASLIHLHKMFSVSFQMLHPQATYQLCNNVHLGVVSQFVIQCNTVAFKPCEFSIKPKANRSAVHCFLTVKTNVRNVRSAWQDSSISHFSPNYDWADINYIIQCPRLATPIKGTKEGREIYSKEFHNCVNNTVLRPCSHTYRHLLLYTQ